MKFIYTSSEYETFFRFRNPNFAFPPFQRRKDFSAACANGFLPTLASLKNAYAVAKAWLRRWTCETCCTSVN